MKKFKILVILVLVGATVILLLREYPTWRRYNRSLASLFSLAQVDDDTKEVEFDPKVSGTDPEVEELIKVLFYGKDLEGLAALVLRYPENEFFIFQLATVLGELEQVDGAIGVMLADRLLALNPENAHYHYLRAYFVLSLESGEVTDGFRSVELGNRAVRFEPSYGRYKDRINRILDFDQWQKYIYLNGGMDFYGKMIGKIYRPTWKSLESNDGLGRRRALLGTVMGERLLKETQKFAPVPFGNLMVYYTQRGLLRYGGGDAEERDKIYHKLGREEAIQSYMLDQMNQANRLETRVEAFKKTSMVLFGILGVLVLHWVLSFILGWWRGREKEAGVGIWRWLVFLLNMGVYGGLVYFLNRDRGRMIDLDFHPEAQEGLHIFLILLSGFGWILFWLMSLIPWRKKGKVFGHWKLTLICSAVIWISCILSLFVISLLGEVFSFPDMLLIFNTLIVSVGAGIALFVIILLVRLLTYRWIGGSRLLEGLAGMVFLASVNHLVSPRYPIWHQIQQFLIPGLAVTRSCRIRLNPFPFFFSDHPSEILRLQ